jgi:predicted nuclease of predicted toxin-antitoxin system
MSVPIVVDMNLSVEWVAELAQHGWTAVHWSMVGDPRAEDSRRAA